MEAKPAVISGAYNTPSAICEDDNADNSAKLFQSLEAKEALSEEALHDSLSTEDAPSSLVQPPLQTNPEEGALIENWLHDHLKDKYPDVKPWRSMELFIEAILRETFPEADIKAQATEIPGIRPDLVMRHNGRTVVLEVKLRSSGVKIKKWADVEKLIRDMKEYHTSIGVLVLSNASCISDYMRGYCKQNGIEVVVANQNLANNLRLAILPSVDEEQDAPSSQAEPTRQVKVEEGVRSENWLDVHLKTNYSKVGKRWQALVMWTKKLLLETFPGIQFPAQVEKKSPGKQTYLVMNHNGIKVVLKVRYCTSGNIRKGYDVNNLIKEMEAYSACRGVLVVSDESRVSKSLRGYCKKNGIAVVMANQNLADNLRLAIQLSVDEEKDAPSSQVEPMRQVKLEEGVRSENWLDVHLKTNYSKVGKRWQALVMWTKKLLLETFPGIQFKAPEKKSPGIKTYLVLDHNGITVVLKVRYCTSGNIRKEYDVNNLISEMKANGAFRGVLVVSDERRVSKPLHGYCVKNGIFVVEANQNLADSLRKVIQASLDCLGASE